MDNIAALAIEDCLIKHLLALCPQMLLYTDIMDADTVRDLIAEPPEVIEQRQENNKRMETLQSVLRICTRHSERYCK